MKTKDFITSHLLELSNKFRDEVFNYHKNLKTFTHIIKVSTEKTFNSDSFKYAEADLYDAFYNLDTDEELLVVSNSTDFGFIEFPFHSYENGKELLNEENIVICEALKETPTSSTSKNWSFTSPISSYSPDLNFALAA